MNRILITTSIISLMAITFPAFAQHREGGGFHGGGGGFHGGGGGFHGGGMHHGGEMHRGGGKHGHYGSSGGWIEENDDYYNDCPVPLNFAGLCPYNNE
jgi:hypothetical protein